MPSFGFGVFQIPKGEATQRAVKEALEAGCRHIDTATHYGNEADVGVAIRASGVPREHVWVTTKVCTVDFGKERTKDAVRRSYDLLELGPINLVLLHFPGPPWLRDETWKGLQECRDEGLVLNIGVSNFEIEHLERHFRVFKDGEIPCVNQFEVSPFLQRRELVRFCQENGILVQAYSALCQGRRIDDPTLDRISRIVSKSPAQILLRWSIQRGLVPLFKSCSPSQRKENFDLFDWTLSEGGQEEGENLMEQLDQLEANFRTGINPKANFPV
uniref:NADP-dependent oxidoreductase domain-containing protein n=1 Tax=Chromera velia CCMP2878 TaxID=1169474 RepID=A0A0G4G3B8_9ALVE|eukprot:Cvel_20024.t1-p1 / transcript=Cvel_20024.t1 / gene=Cvel_20024 / organism=Chromera_velia_CCMP2878 / gene_product=Prostaglandin F synthase, putative / transcript_product=Prostaglandin F synthase, putative / location=Cvel_scaffold1768:8190-9002(-) / protein_length=271 / sequence_SO=supercontig / SO=protein_coding / is_pseudo=false